MGSEGKLYLTDGAYFRVRGSTSEQFEIFLDALRRYGCTNVPSEPTGEMLSAMYIIYSAGSWYRSRRMYISSDGAENTQLMKYEVILTNAPKAPESAPTLVSQRAGLRTILVTVQALLDDLDRKS